MSSKEACPVCDRSDCPEIPAAALALKLWGSQWRLLKGPERLAFKAQGKAATIARRAAKRDCMSHAVDWRARALKAEAALEELFHV